MTCKRTRKISGLSLGLIMTLTALVASGQTHRAVRSLARPSLSLSSHRAQPSGATQMPPFALPQFLPGVVYGSGFGTANSILAVDLNGDHNPDLIVANSCFSSNDCSTGGVSVLLGNSDGTFQPAVTYGSGGAGAISVAVADLNGDGKLDLAVANFNDINIGILLGNGDGTFQPAAIYRATTPGSSCPHSIAIGDMNGDGKPDLVWANQCLQFGGGQNVGVGLGNGDGTFQQDEGYVPGGQVLEAIAIADVNRDGKPDVLALNFLASFVDTTHSTVGVLFGNGDGTVQDPGIFYTGGGGALALAVADLNGDGILDLAVANSKDGNVGVLLGNGDGTFQTAATYDLAGSGAGWVTIADVNGDAKPDLIVASCGTLACSTSAVSVLRGNGDGTFQAAVSYPSGGFGASSVAVADVNHDGRPDLLVTTCADQNCTAGEVSVLLQVGNRPTTTTVVSSLNPSVFGQSVTLTASVTSGSGTPDGTVIFFDGSTAIGSAVLSNGHASISTTALAAESQSIVAIYQGSLKFHPSASAPLTQMVSVATTITTIASSPNPAQVNQEVDYLASFNGQFAGPLTGLLTFQEQGVFLASVNLDGKTNTAGYGSSYGMAGIHTLTAIYSGDANNVGSSGSVTEYVQGSSSTIVKTSGSPSFVGQPVTFTATVTSKFGTIPNGDLVTFYDGTTVLGSVALSGQTAALTTSSLSAKTHTINATYSGDSIFTPSSGKVKQAVQRNPTTTSLTSAPNPSQFRQAVTFTAQVVSAGPAPTGKVKFIDGTHPIGSTTLNGGVASLTKSTLVVGTHPITAQYVGDSASVKSTSPVVNQVVQ